MPTSAEELAAKQANVVKLREQVAAEEAKRVEHEAGLTNKLVADQLDAEAANLERQLAAAKAANKPVASASAKGK